MRAVFWKCYSRLTNQYEWFDMACIVSYGGNIAKGIGMV